MSTDDAVLDIQKLSRHEFVARSILPRFPLSTLKIEESQAGKIFDIYFQEKLILSLNKRGARYFFPSRRKRMLKWDKASSFGLARTVDYLFLSPTKAYLVHPSVAYLVHPSVALALPRAPLQGLQCH